MQRKYMVISSGINKDTGEKYTTAGLIREDNKNGKWAFIDTKDRYTIDGEQRPLGTVITTEMEEV